MPESTSSPPSAQPKLLGEVGLVLLAAACVPLLSPPLGSADLFWHTTVGRHIIDVGYVGDMDPFQALQPPRAWTTFQWLYEVALGWLEPYLGLTGLRWLHGVIGGIAVWAWGRGLARGRGWGPALAALLCGVFLFVYADRIRIRPHVVTIALVGLLLPVLLEPGRKRRWLASVAAVAGMTLLANLHAGGGTIALALLFASTAGTLARSGGEPGTRLRAAGLLVASAVAASLSPGYLKGTYTALRMESATRALFHEWQPPAAYFDAPAADLFVRGHHLLMGALPYVTALALAGLSLALLWRRGLDASRAMKDLPAVALAFAACILSMRSVRFVPYVLLALPGLLALIACLRDAETRPSRPLTPRLAAAAVACGLLLVFGAHLYRAGFSGGLRAAVSAWQEDLVPGLYPVGVADHLEATGAEGGVFNLSALHGSYLIWRLWPRVSVHFDGRGNLDAEEAARIELLRQRRADPRMGGRTEEIYLETGLPFVLAPAPVFPPNAPPKAFRLRAADPVAQLWERVSPRD